MKKRYILSGVFILLCTAITGYAQNTAPFWSLAGNSNAAATSKLGTTNAVPLRLLTNNAVRVYIASGGNVGIGTTAPSYKLQVAGAANGIFGSGTTYGVRGSGGTYGLYGSGTYGVYGSGTYGLYGSGSSYGSIAYGGATGAYGNGTSYGVYGYSSGGYGVAGISSSSYGLYGSSSSSWGSVAYGVYGAFGSGTSGYGVQGVSTDSYGVSGSSTNSYGLYGSGYDGSVAYGSYIGAYGSAASYGLYGSGGTYGVYGSGTSYGVYGYSSGGNGLYAYSSNSNGIWSYAASSGTSGIYAGVFESKVWSYGGYFESSDKNLKKNIKDLGNAMNIINQLKPKNYEFRDDGDLAQLQLPKGLHYGLLAQDLELVLPDLVNDGPKRPAISAASGKQPGSDGKSPTLPQDQQMAKPADQKEIKSFKGVNYTELIPIMIKGMQEQDALIQKQQAQINELKSMLASVKANVASDAVDLNGAWLKQNAPNPFRQSTTIQFSLPVSAKDAQLLVYDQSGRLVKSVAVANGQNQVSIAKGSLPSGNYVYTLMVDGKKIDSKNMIVTQ